jgi:hypothetical protein
MNIIQQNVNESVNLDDIVSNNGSVQNERPSNFIANSPSVMNKRGIRLTKKQLNKRKSRTKRANKIDQGIIKREDNKTVTGPRLQKLFTEPKGYRELTQSQLRKQNARQTLKNKKFKHSTNQPKIADSLKELFGMNNNEENMNESVSKPKKTVRFTSNVEYNEYLKNMFSDMPQNGMPNGAMETFIDNVIIPEGKTLKQLRVSHVSQCCKMLKNVSEYHDNINSYLEQLKLLEKMIKYQELQGIELATMKPRRNMGTTRPPVNAAKPPRECPEGQEVSARTGRCIKKCVPPQVRNPETGRCKKP